ncbi:putative LRR containing protein [Trachipleistophora hominis]|uniref:Putative LRR containing protein n=1 Tax=Trachipleistophora hominis TaxID=72359 RepID=L7JYU3_TRAHO|nr:putative LRR containing protein [Trachipleistophora hominis]
MNCHLPHISNIMTKWILCFYSERENTPTDTILCDSLEDMNLMNVFTHLSEDIIKNKTLSVFKIEDYDTVNDPLKVLRPKIKEHSNSNTNIRDEDESMEGIDTTDMECSYDNSVVKNRNEDVSVKRDDPKDGEYKYRTIQIPVTKPLFMKVVNLKTDSNVKLSDDELYITICHLLTFLHNKTPLLQTLAQQLLDDSELSSRLSVIDKEQTEKNRETETKHSTNTPFRQELENAICEMLDCIDISTTDKFGNAAIAGRDSDSRSLAYADIYSLCYFFLPRYIRMDGYFLICNHELLCKYYENISSGFGLTLDIDFSDVFYRIEKNSTSEKDSTKKVAEQLNKVLKCEFLALDCLEVCIFRLTGVQNHLSFKDMSTKQLHIYYKECIFSERSQLPLNLKVLSISESKINCNLTLPDTLETIILEKA